MPSHAMVDHLVHKHQLKNTTNINFGRETWI